MTGAVTLETERLVLRMFEPADFETYAGICGDPEGMRFIGDGQPLAPPMAWRSLAMVIGHWALRGYGLWAATEGASGTLVGRVGFWNPHDWPASSWAGSWAEPTGDEAMQPRRPARRWTGPSRIAASAR